MDYPVDPTHEDTICTPRHALAMEDLAQEERTATSPEPMRHGVRLLSVNRNSSLMLSFLFVLSLEL